MSEDRQTDPTADVRFLRHQVDSLTREVNLIKVRGRAVAAAFLSVVAIAIPAYGTADDAVDEGQETTISLWDLVDQAEATDNGTVNVVAVIAILALIASILWCAYSAFSRTRLTATVGFAIGGLTIAAWVVLFFVVQVSGGEGAVGELGYESAVGSLLVPIAAAFTFAAAHAVRSAPD